MKQAAEALSLVKTTRIDQTPIEDEVLLLSSTAFMLLDKERRDLRTCKIMAYLTTKKVLGYLQYKVLRHQRNRNRQTSELHTRVHKRNWRAIRIVAKRHLQAARFAVQLRQKLVLDSYFTHWLGGTESSSHVSRSGFIIPLALAGIGRIPRYNS